MKAIHPAYDPDFDAPAAKPIDRATAFNELARRLEYCNLISLATFILGVYVAEAESTWIGFSMMALGISGATAARTASEVWLREARR